MSGSSSVAAMKKVVQQLRLEAGLNRVKVSGRGRAVGPVGKRGPTCGSLGRAVGCGRGGVPPFRRPRTVPAPAGLRTGRRVSTPTSVSSHTSHPALTPGTRPLHTHESARVAPDCGLMSNFCLGSPRTPPLFSTASNKGVSNRRHSVLASDLAGVSVYCFTPRRSARLCGSYPAVWLRCQVLG